MSLFIKLGSVAGLFVAGLLLACSGGGGGGGRGELINLGRACPEFDPVVETAEAVVLTNDERARAGVGSLTGNPTLNAVAENYAMSMATQDFTGHVNPYTGEDAGDRVTVAGYAWIAVAENLAYGPCSADSAVNGWMTSPGHRENMLGAVYTEIGIGVYHGGPEETYWVQVLATPPG